MAAAVGSHIILSVSCTWFAPKDHCVSCRYTYLLNLAVTHGQPLLMVGPTGTGKSTYINRYLLQGLPQDVWVPLNITLSARTTSNMVQEQVGICLGTCSFPSCSGDTSAAVWQPHRHWQPQALGCCAGVMGTCKSSICWWPMTGSGTRLPCSSKPIISALNTCVCCRSLQVDSRLDKRKKGVYGPPIGKRCVVFVDDLNMPAKEVYGAQPPIELLRQLMDQQGW